MSGLPDIRPTAGASFGSRWRTDAGAARFSSLRFVHPGAIANDRAIQPRDLSKKGGTPDRFGFSWR